VGRGWNSANSKRSRSWQAGGARACADPAYSLSRPNGGRADLAPPPASPFLCLTCAIEADPRGLSSNEEKMVSTASPCSSSRRTTSLITYYGWKGDGGKKWDGERALEPTYLLDHLPGGGGVGLGMRRRRTTSLITWRGVGWGVGSGAGRKGMRRGSCRRSSSPSPATDQVPRGQAGSWALGLTWGLLGVSVAGRPGGAVRSAL
jgi:hypothetical protein